MTLYTVEYLDSEGAVHCSTVRGSDEDDALDAFKERYAGTRTAIMIYEKEPKE